MINSIQSEADISYLTYLIMHLSMFSMMQGRAGIVLIFSLSYLPILLRGFLTLLTSRELLLVQTNDIFPIKNQQNLLSVLTFKA